MSVIETAKAIAREAGAMIKSHMGTGFITETKARASMSLLKLTRLRSSLFGSVWRKRILIMLFG